MGASPVPGSVSLQPWLGGPPLWERHTLHYISIGIGEGTPKQGKHQLWSAEGIISQTKPP
ncbi:hypothetical protein C9439_05885 [archaeon SCG-AAA382B04]|nr:hypothetical protein C9439_05885 [archaeon SCG-AAA382B04]